MTFQEIRIIATAPCIANQLRDVNTIWYAGEAGILLHIFGKFMILKLKSSRLKSLWVSKPKDINMMVCYGWRKSKKIKSLGVSKPKDINMMVYYGWRKSKKIKSLGVSKPKDINMMVYYGWRKSKEK